EGKGKISTCCEVINPDGSVPSAPVQDPDPAVGDTQLQSPASSKVIVKLKMLVIARAGDGAKVSATAANAASPSANRFMIGTPLDRLSHPLPASSSQSSIVNRRQRVFFLDV